MSCGFDGNLEGSVLLLEDTVGLHARVVLSFPFASLSDDVVVLFLVEVHFGSPFVTVVSASAETFVFFLELFEVKFAVVMRVNLTTELLFKFVEAFSQFVELFVITGVILDGLFVLELILGDFRLHFFNFNIELTVRFLQHDDFFFESFDLGSKVINN